MNLCIILPCCTYGMWPENKVFFIIISRLNIFISWLVRMKYLFNSCYALRYRASDFPFQKKQFSVSKKVKFRFDSISLLATLNSMKSQYIERKCGERTVKMAQLVR